MTRRLVWSLLLSNRMDALAIVLIIIGTLATVVGSIMLIIAAFRVGVGWGLAYLFLPFAALFFIIVHWAEARRGFVWSLLGVMVLVGGVFTSPSVRGGIANGIAQGMPTLELPGVEKKKPSDLNAGIEQKRAEIEQLEAQFQRQSAMLATQYQALSARRAALQPGDTAAIEAFNVEAASYQQANASLKQLRQQADAAQREHAGLLDERSRQHAAANTAPPHDLSGRAGTESVRSAAQPRRGNAQVVIYSTKNCGWCTRAKQYFAQRGVAYEERDVQQSAAAKDEFKRLGGNGVPLIMVGSEKIEGFDQKRLDQIL